MQRTALTGNRWSTASCGEPADTTPMELQALGDHLTQCCGAVGARGTVNAGIEALRRAVTAHFVTTLVVLAVLLAGFLTMV